MLGQRRIVVGTFHRLKVLYLTGVVTPSVSPTVVNRKAATVVISATERDRPAVASCQCEDHRKCEHGAQDFFIKEPSFPMRESYLFSISIEYSIVALKSMLRKNFSVLNSTGGERDVRENLGKVLQNTKASYNNICRKNSRATVASMASTLIV
jgi:hypothetical protein